MKPVRKFIPVDYLDTEAAEGWLEEMALKGYRVIEFGNYFAKFQQAEPAAVRYRLLPILTPGKPDPEFLADCQGSGWEYLCQVYDQYHLYTTDDPDAPEMHTDPVAQGYALDADIRKFDRELRFSILASAAALILVFLICEGYRKGPLLLLLTASSSFGFLYPPLLFLILWQMLRSNRNMHRLRQQLQAGIPARHRQAKKRRSIPQRAIVLFYILLYSLSSLLLLQADTTRMGSLAHTEMLFPRIPLTVLTGEVPLTGYPAPFQDFGRERNNLVVHRRFILSQRYEVDQLATVADSDDWYDLYMAWYDLPDLLPASLLAGEVIHYHTEAPLLSRSKLTVPGFDTVVTAQTPDSQILFASVGDKAVYLSYHGQGVLTDYLDEVAQVLDWDGQPS